MKAVGAWLGWLPVVLALGVVFVTDRNVLLDVLEKQSDDIECTGGMHRGRKIMRKLSVITGVPSIDCRGRIYPYYLLVKLYAETDFYQPDKLYRAAKSVPGKEPQVNSEAVRQMRDEVRKIIKCK